MVSDKVDLSLDDIIASNRKSGGRGRGGRGRGGRGASRGRGSSSRGGGGAFRNNNRGRGDSRNTPYSRPKSLPDRWAHDMYDGSSASGGASGGAARRGSFGEGLQTGATLQITNLDFGVTESDVKELFSEFGRLKKVKINYDVSGRSQGTADVVFERRDDAKKALKTYNGVPLDGRPMKIVTVTMSSSFVERSPGRGRFNNVGGGRGGNFSGQRRGGFRNNDRRESGGGRGGESGGGRGGRGGGRGRGRGGRGRGGREAPPSKEDLDKELDSYIDAKV